MVAVDVAIAELHEKEHLIRVSCVEFDTAVANLKQMLQLPFSQSNWASATATRLNFINKQHRTNLKNDLQAMSTKLRQVYGNGSRHTTAGVVSRLEERLKNAQDNLSKSDFQMAECQTLYNARVADQSLSLACRVRLFRGMPNLRKALEQAHAYDEQLKISLDTWKPYFDLLASQTALSKLMEDIRARKVTRTALEVAATPMFDSLRQLHEIRDSIVNEGSKLALNYESAWLALGDSGVRTRNFRGALRQLDAVLEKASQQQPAQTMIVQDILRLTTIALEPTSLPEPGGSTITIENLRKAYTQFEAVHNLCDVIDHLLAAVLVGLEAHLEDLRAT